MKKTKSIPITIECEGKYCKGDRCQFFEEGSLTEEEYCTLPINGKSIVTQLNYLYNKHEWKRCKKCLTQFGE